jgi:hypothetical protein
MLAHCTRNSVCWKNLWSQVSTNAGSLRQKFCFSKESVKSGINKCCLTAPEILFTERICEVRRQQMLSHCARNSVYRKNLWSQASTNAGSLCQKLCLSKVSTTETAPTHTTIIAALHGRRTVFV